MAYPSGYRIVRAGVCTAGELAEMTLDDVDLWNLWIDAEDEAQLIAREKARSK
jgi:hypothetical protein